MTSIVTASNVIQGPANVYVGAFGAAEPVDGVWTAVDSTIWVPAGATTGGVKLSASMTYKEISVDQVPDPIGVRMTGRAVEVATTLAESTLENIKSLMNGGAITVGGGASIGTGTIVASTGVITASATHGLAVGDPVILGAITTTTGVTAGVIYYALTVPSATTFTLSATVGGSALTLTTNGSTASITKGTYRAFVPVSSAAGFQPTYSALMLEGPVPGLTASFVRRVIVRKVLSTAGFDLAYEKDNPMGLTAKFGAYYITDSILPFKLVDQIS